MIRVKVEIVPHGRVDASEVLHDIWIENDGTSIAGVGPDEGGIGNYNIFPDGETLSHLHVVDYPSIVREWNEQVKAAEAEPGFDRARAPVPPKIEREFEVA